MFWGFWKWLIDEEINERKNCYEVFVETVTNAQIETKRRNKIKAIDT